jgi:hypothetical protein
MRQTLEDVLDFGQTVHWKKDTCADGVKCSAGRCQRFPRLWKGAAMTTADGF